MKAFSKQKTLTVLLACALLGCATATPADTIDAFFEALREDGLEATSAFLKPPFPATEVLEGDDKKFAEAYFARITYEIQEVATKGDEATVSVVLHYPDNAVVVSVVMSVGMRGVVDRLGGGEGVSGDNVTALLLGLYESDALPLLSKTTEVRLVRDDGWKILSGENVNTEFFMVLTFALD
jgi:hypothetical protein